MVPVIASTGCTALGPSRTRSFAPASYYYKYLTDLFPMVAWAGFKRDGVFELQEAGVDGYPAGRPEFSEEQLSATILHLESVL
jgi:hypothetical protein